MKIVTNQLTFHFGQVTFGFIARGISFTHYRAYDKISFVVLEMAAVIDGDDRQYASFTKENRVVK